MGSTSNWQDIVREKRASVAALIPKEWLLPSSITDGLSETSTVSVLDIPRTCSILTPKELEITEKYDATDLVNLMSEAKLSSVEVVTAFCKRAAIAQQCVNCLTEIFFEQALVRAKECDEYLAKNGKPMGPLHGLPISLKDSFNVKGVHSTIGYVSFISRPPAATNSPLVDVLLPAGAVFYCKTNLPQTMMTADSHNNVFGRTLNPHNLSLTAGGSTGGEAALIAMRGSILGMATDIAGSDRIPALCCGVSSIKPTASRVPFGGVPPGRLGSPGQILPVIGPCGHSVRDYGLFLKTVMDGQPWNLSDTAVNVPWRTVQPVSKSLRFGLIRGCKERPLHPPIARTLHSVATLLKQHGHSIVLLDEKIPNIFETAKVAFKYFMLDPQETDMQHVHASGEPVVPSIPTARFKELEGWKPTLEDLWELNMEKGKICRAYHDLMVGEQLDAILMCGYQSTAVPHDTYGVPIYTVLQNLLNYPSGILPFGEASKELDQSFFKTDAAYEPPYDADRIEGAPAHVQITGRPMMDEELIEVMKVVEDILKTQVAP